MLMDVIAQLKNKRILVLGAGLTGMSCVRFLNKHGLEFDLNDSRSTLSNLHEIKTLLPQPNIVLGYWDYTLITSADVIFASPGIDLNAEALTSVIPNNCIVMGDVELFCQITDKPILAITGSNGKSTLVTLLAHLGQRLGINSVLGGNIGTPVLEQLNDEIDCYVLELSSFQLETLTSMKAVASTVLNVSDDHLDRHKTIENYSKIKQKVYQQSQYAVINRDDVLSHSSVNDKNNNIISFGSDEPKSGEFGLTFEEQECFLMFGNEKLISMNNLPLAGVHNALNYLAALALGYCNQWSIHEMVEHLTSFSGLAHRCQRIPTNDSIVWINDSKATNIGATIAAIHGLSPSLVDNKLILLAGGDGKGADFSPLKALFEQFVSCVITIGKDGDSIAKLSDNSQQCKDLLSAVKYAKKIADAGDIVLLSPACASIDMFKNFNERGEVFTDAVLALQEAS